MAIDDLIKGLNSVQNAVNNNIPLNQNQMNQFKADGFLLPATFSADGNGLPYNKVDSYKESTSKRNIITWFVPEFGIVRMYVNPSLITYNHKKLINRDRTKGGYTIQYWGEELSTLNISGTTGSSGIEGINVLYEIYRAEQYAFDAVGLSLAANNAASPNLLNSLLGTGDSTSSLLGGSVNGAVGLVSSLLGIDQPNTALVASTIPSLAQLATGIEMYYNGWVYRGYFETMTITESATDFNFQYQMTFVVTQRRGYRQNYLPYHRSAKDGPSSYTTPQSFSGHVKVGI